MPRPGQLRDPLVVGTLCGLLAAAGYTATNVCLREVADHDAVWVSCLRALPTVLLFGPWLVWRRVRGETVLPPLKVLGIIVLGACAAQLCGNLLFQWSLRIVGIALAVPLCLGTLIVGGAVLGRLLLREPITWRAATALSLLVASIAVLSLGAREAHVSVARDLGLEHVDSSHVDPGVWHIGQGVLAACASGICFALLGVTIRYSVTNRAAPTTMMFTVGMVGTVGLGSIVLYQQGFDALTATPPRDLALMLGAGILNALSFIFMTRSLQLTSVAYAYALNATQATLGALAGILIFREATTPWLGLGVVLTIAGLLWLSRK